MAWPFSPVPFEVPRVWFFDRWVELLLVFGIFNLRCAKNRPNYLLLGPILLFLVVSGVVSWYGVDWQKSVLGNYYRADGLVTLYHLVVFVFLTAFFWRSAWKTTLVHVHAASSSLVAVWAVCEFVRLHFYNDLTVPNFAGAVGGLFGQPNFLAGYLLVGIPFSVYALSISSQTARPLFRIGIILQVLAVFLTMSWGGLLGLALVPVICFLLSKRRFALKVLAGVFAITIFSAAIVYYSQTRPKFVSGKGEEFLHPESRQRIVANALYAVSQKPLFGWGWANFDYAFKANPADLHFESDVYVDKAHSVLLELLVTTGLAGVLQYLLIAIFCCLSLILKLMKNSGWTKALLVSYLLYLFHSQTNVISINEEFFFWLVVGIVASRARLF